MNRQIVMLCSADKCKLVEKNLPYIRQNLCAQNIVVVTARRNFAKLQAAAQKHGFALQDEDAVLEGLTFERIAARVERIFGTRKLCGWYLQQFVKMAWAFSPGCANRYTVWDCDTIPLQRIEFEWRGKICCNLKSECHQPYFDTIFDLLGIEKQLPSSFISEFMTFDRALMQELVREIEASPKYGGTFYERILSSIEAHGKPERGFSEFETYGTFALARRPELLAFAQIPTKRNAAEYCGKNPPQFALRYLGRNYATASFESWSKPKPLKCTAFLLYAFAKEALRAPKGGGTQNERGAENAGNSVNTKRTERVGASGANAERADGIGSMSGEYAGASRANIDQAEYASGDANCTSNDAPASGAANEERQ